MTLHASPPSSFYREKAAAAAQLACLASDPTLRAKLEDAARVWNVIADRTVQHELAAAQKSAAAMNGPVPSSQR